MKYLRYYSEFYSRDNIRYRVEIWQEAETAYTPKEVMLSAEPVTIEWAEVDRLAPVHSSSATVNLISMTDREFTDMYSVEPRTIRLDIYRNEMLYWSGTADTELFEEPYAYKNRYVTSLTFSDFAVLDRLSWEARGIKTLGEIVDLCIEAAGIEYLQQEKHISTSIDADGVGDIFTDCSVICENFYDEDGEPWTMREVLDETLRPFALRLKQKNGSIWIGDINALSAIPPARIEWRANDSTLGVEPTYNKVIVSYSPYSDGDVYDGSFDYDELSVDKIGGGGGAGIAFVPMPGTEYNGFTFRFGTEFGALTKVQNLYVGGGARLFRIEPEEDGTEEAGVMWGIRPSGDVWMGKEPVTLAHPIEGETIIMQSPRIPMVKSSDRFRLKISVDVLCDPRMNPFEEANEYNEEGNWADFDKWINFGGIPCELTLYGFDGKIYKCDNRGVYGNTNKSLWKEPEAGKVYRLWLEYYDEGDRENKTGFGGWQTNKRNIQFSTDKLSKSLTLHIEGEHVLMPPVSGELQMSIYAGVMGYAGSFSPMNAQLAELSRWICYKGPKITLVKDSGGDIEAEDMVTSAWINKHAEEDLKISTYIGTPSTRIPIAKGAILSSDNEIIREFTRAGVTDTLERLLIGTVYSNYSQRMNTLAGTVKLIPSSEILSDISMVDSVYMILSEVQNLAAETSEVKIAEIAPDSFEGIEYEEPV